MFDYVDIVFMDGDGNLLPWLRKCEKVTTILTVNIGVASNSVQNVQDD